MKEKSSRLLAGFLAFSVIATSLPGIPARAAGPGEETAAVSQGAEETAFSGDGAAETAETECRKEDQKTENDEGKTGEPETEESEDIRGGEVSTEAETAPEKETDPEEETKPEPEEEEEKGLDIPKGQEPGSGEAFTEGAGAAEPVTEVGQTESRADGEAGEAPAKKETESAEVGREKDRLPQLPDVTAENMLFTDMNQTMGIQLLAAKGAGIQVLKASDSSVYKMFQVDDSAAKINQEKSTIEITIYTSSVSYDKLYFGKKEDEPKEPVAAGTPWNGSGWSFSFEVPLEKSGQKIPVCLGKKDGSWYTSNDLVMTIPDGLALNPAPDPAPAPEEKPADPQPAPLPEQSSGDTYDVIEVDSSASMFKVTDCMLITENGKTGAVITLSGTGYDYLYLGTAADAEKAPASEYISFAENEAGAYTYTLAEVALDTPVAVAAHSKKNDRWYDRTLTFKSDSRKRIAKEGDYRAEVESSASMFRVVNCVLASRGGSMHAAITLSGTGYDYLYLGTAADAQAASAEKWIPFEEREPGVYTYTLPVSALDVPLSVAAHSKKNDKWYDRSLTFRSGGMKRTLEDGTYQVPVESSAAMFKVTDCVLTAKGGDMYAVITLSGTGYDYLYLGTADKAGDFQAEWISFVENETGAYTYTLPVSALDTPILVAAHSKKNDKWYDRSLTFKTEGARRLSGEGGRPGGNEQPGTDQQPGDNGSQTEPPAADNTADKESSYESDTSGSTRRVDSSVNLPDGVYKPDKFSWSGGTGRISISCPKITVTGGKAYATLIFSSDSYTYVKANGNRYSASTGGGTSTFVIPVELNKNNTVIGMTTKMSASHEIVYSIYIYLAAAENGGEPGDADGLSGETLDEEAPKIIGLTYESETEVGYAEQFKIYHYNDGITLLEISLARGRKDREGTFPEEDGTQEIKEPEETGEETEEETDAEALEEDGADDEVIVTEAELTAKLYQEKVVRYLLVPEETELPVGLEKEAVIIRLPAERAYVASAEALGMLEQLEALDAVTAVGFEKEECPVESLAEAMEVKQGEEEAAAVFGGLFDAPDFKTLLGRKCGLALLPGELLPGEPEENTEDKNISSDGEETEGRERGKETVLGFEEQKERFEKLTERFSMLSIPVILDGSADEKTELASYEWIKVYGILFDCEQEAEELFEAAVKAAEKAEAEEKAETEELTGTAQKTREGAER